MFGLVVSTGCVSSLDDLTSTREEVSQSTDVASSTVSTSSTCSESDCSYTERDAGSEPDAAATPSSSGFDSSAPPNVACGPGTYVVAGQSTIECRACPDGTFSTAAGLTECALWTDCQAGEYVSVEGSAVRDRECEACPSNETSDVDNAPSCVPKGCAAGETKDESGDCIACEAGNYCAGGVEVAVPCDADTWDDDGSAATACVARRTCGAGEHVSDEGNATTDRTCLPCEPGTYNLADNASACTDLSVCEAGTYVAAEGTSVKDTECVECEPGTFSATPNATSCSMWTECEAPDNRVLDEPTASTDRTCTACTEPYVTRENNEIACGLYAFLPTFGEVVIEAENYFAMIPRGDVPWTLFEDPSLSGGAAMQLGPDTDMMWTVDPATTAPELQFRVNFSDQGSYYVHLRGDAGVASNASSESCFAGIDGLTQQYSFDTNAGVWGWRSHNFSVTSAGVHNVSIYGREDGFRVDKIVVNTAANAPSGVGPEESEFDESLEPE